MSASALVYWMGGMGAWAYSRGGVNALSAPGQWFGRQPGATQAAVVPAVLAAVVATGLVVNQLVGGALRMFEGRWPSWTAPLHHWLVARRTRRAAAEDDAWEHARNWLQPPATPTARQVLAYTSLEQRRRRRPALPNYLLPTKVGNILRAADLRIGDKYGLDNAAVWPRLLLILPDPARTQLATARAAVDRTTTAAVFGVLFCCFAAFTPLVIPIGLALTAGAVLVVLPARVQALSDLMEAAYDLHREALYRQLRWPVPTNPKDDRAQGMRLSAYLRDGSDSTDPTFTSAA
jgi:hypothetical protein